MKLSDRTSSAPVKLIYIGDSGTGKTGSLTSLVKAGYNLRILDMDNGLDSLYHYARAEGLNLDTVEYETARDTYKSTPVGPVVRNPKAYIKAVELMNKWSDGTTPQEWDSNTVFIIDSLTSLGKSAFEWAKGMNPGAKDPRQWYFTAQQSIENVLAMLTSEEFHANVIVISHINYRELQDGTTKGYPSAIGSALGPTISKYFNTLVMAESAGSGKNLRRRIRTMPTAIIDLKAPSPLVDGEYPLETGLATLFTKLKGLDNA